MKQELLLPNRFKSIGWCILLPSVVLGVIISLTGHEVSWLNAKVFALFDSDFIGTRRAFTFISTNLTNTLTGALFIIGAVLVSFSREKKEDEYIAKLRLSSLLWAVCVSYILLLIAFLFVYGGAFFTVMIYNMFTVLIIFIARFNYILYRNAHTASDEK